MAGSQKQLSSTGKQRNAVTGRPAKAASRPKPVPSDRCVLLSTKSTGCELNRSEAARILLARWHRNPHRCSRSDKAYALCQFCPTKSTSFPETVIYHLLDTDASLVVARMQTRTCWSMRSEQFRAPSLGVHDLTLASWTYSPISWSSGRADSGTATLPLRIS